MSNLSIPSDRIFITPDPELLGLLAHLHLKIEYNPSGSTYLTRSACNRVHLSFEFFRAFARLTYSGDNRNDNAATRLLAPSLRQNKMVESLAQKTTAPINTVDRWQEVETERTTTARKSNPRLDSHLDAYEADVLKTALRILGTGRDGNKNRSQRMQTTKRRINDLGADPCWLSEQAMRVGLFGNVNGELFQWMSVRAYMGMILPGSQRETTSAQISQCAPLTSMRDLTLGLSFPAWHMQEPIRHAAGSTVVIGHGDGRGSGVVIADHYILTAKHVVDGAEKEGSKLVLQATIGLNGQSITSKVEVIAVPGIDGHADPDLAILYVPELPSNARPIPFSSALRLEETEVSSEPQSKDLSQWNADEPISLECAITQTVSYTGGDRVCDRHSSSRWTNSLIGDIWRIIRSSHHRRRSGIHGDHVSYPSRE